MNLIDSFKKWLLSKLTYSQLHYIAKSYRYVECSKCGFLGLALSGQHAGKHRGKHDEKCEGDVEIKFFR